jgi:hypothetical protein
MAVNRVESLQSDGMHHMDIMALLFTGLDLPVGEYACADLYATYQELMDKGLFLYASQQAEQTIQLPPGVAADLPPKLRIMQEIHYVNTTDAPIEAFSKVNVYSFPRDQVTQTIWGGAVRDTTIEIPAGASDHVEWTRCVMNQDVDVLFLATHTHALASRTVVRAFDGTNVGAELYTNTDWQSPKLQSFGETPLRLTAGTGLEFACHYDNPGTEPVRWGFNAADEMCQIAIVFTPGEAARECEIVAQSE